MLGNIRATEADDETVEVSLKLDFFQNSESKTPSQARTQNGSEHSQKSLSIASEPQTNEAQKEATRDSAAQPEMFLTSEGDASLAQEQQDKEPEDTAHGRLLHKGLVHTPKRFPTRNKLPISRQESTAQFQPMKLCAQTTAAIHDNA
ncbi:hypothetical protein BC939DRAFT_473006 [Gamsiella multidivaricata]|uniref:uncharacterized protein n=1 Tax=Gamsiella multidivaricata TaxID=101098 RepID=UPI00221E608D|nr:uncharacterized protein BC939DRAFT_473006 [Gamsiella multidivaricata]KAI7831437.1 hypothetical protein BC939DRAFT_473006 [Gamsiella multidivaricata]